MKRRILKTLLAAGFLLTLTSCLFRQAAMFVVRDEYPNERPPMVIADINGKPAHQRWEKLDAEALPPPYHMRKTPRYAEDGIPYGLSTGYSDIVASPYDPYMMLDYRGVKVGSKVWDPYTRKPFYIPRVYKVN